MELTRIEAEGAGLTDKQRAFVDAILSGASNRDALTLAGYSQVTDPASVVGSVAVQRALDAGCKAVLRGELRPLALTALKELLGGKTPAATRFQAAKFVVEQSDDGQGEEKPLSEMTEAELLAVVEKAQRRVDEARKPQIIDVTPGNGAQPPSQSAPRP